MAQDENRSAPAAQRIAGRYEVLGRLGSGPHGPTYRARDHRRLEAPEEEREVALKILRLGTEDEAPEALDARLAELAGTLAELDEPAILAPRDSGRTELGLPYVAYELVHGASLEERLQTGGPLPRDEARELVRWIAEALEKAHERGIVHGALDAHHVLVVETPRGPRPRLMDVGLAATLWKPADGAASTGSPPSARDDIRAVGHLLAAVLSGDPGGDTLPAEVDVETVRIVEDALDELGFQEMRALRAALSDPPPVPAPVDPLRRGVLVRPGPSRRPLLALSLVLALAAAGAAWLVRGRLEARAAEQAARERDREQAERQRLEQAIAEREVRERELEEALAAARQLLEEQEPAAAEAADEAAAERARLEATVAELSDTLTAARGETQSLREEMGEELRAQAQLAREHEAARLEAQAALERERQRLASVAHERDEAQATVEELEAQERERARALDLVNVLAEGLEERLGEGDPRAVWSLLEGLEAEGRLEPGLAADPWIEAWTDAADLVRRAEAADAAAAGELVGPAEAALGRARARQGAFVLALRARFGTRPALENALDDELDALEGRLEARLTALAAAREAEWRAILADPLAAEPRRSLELARSFAGDRTPALAQALVEAVERGASDAGSELAALRALPSLAPWVDGLLSESGPEPGGERLASALRLAWAQLWFAPGADADPSGGERLAQAFERWDPPTAAGSEGSVALATEVGLLHPRGPYPGPDGRRALYRTLTADGEEGWQIETVLRESSVGAGEEALDAPLTLWRVSQRFYDATGRLTGERTLRLSRDGRRILEESVGPRVVFEAARTPRATTRWTPPEDTPPPRLPLATDAVAAFRERLASAPATAIEVEADGATALWSAALGLVRYEAPGLVTRELFYAD